MKTVKVLYGQTWLDLAVQETGDATRAMEMAILNDVSMTDSLTAGESVLAPDPERGKKSVVLLFTDKANAPASEDIVGEMKSNGEGIEYWAIEKDFVVQ